MTSHAAKEQTPGIGRAGGEVPPVHTIHDGVESWTDTCSCEAEPRWQALADELERTARASTTNDATHDASRGATASD
jgi:hypothetical protein